MISRTTVYLVAVNIAVAVNYAVFAGEVYVLSLNMELVGLPFFSPQFAAEVLIGGVNYQLVSIVSVVAETVVKVIIHYRCTCTKGDSSVEIGEKVDLIVVVMFGYGEFGVEYHPVDKVSHLAHTAAKTRRWVVGEYGKTLTVAFFHGKAAHKVPERKGFTGADNNTVDLWRSE